MSDTIDRLVRMLDEEREGHRRAREHEGRMAQLQSTTSRSLERSQKDCREAVAKIEELEEWIENLFHQVPEKDRKKWGKCPAKFDDVPF